MYNRVAPHATCGALGTGSDKMAKNNYVLAEEPAADLAVLEAFAAELEEYIIKDELYRTVRVHLPAGDQMIQMSGGDLLTRPPGRRARPPDAGAATRFDAARSSAEKTIYSLRTRFHQRLLHEVRGAPGQPQLVSGRVRIRAGALPRRISF